MRALASITMLDGRPMVEDPLSLSRAVAGRRALAEAIVQAGGDDLTTGDVVLPAEEPALDDVRADWVAKGWSRSLEYFEWSLPTFGRYDVEPRPPPIAPSELWSVLLGRRTHRVFDPGPVARQDVLEVLAAPLGEDRPGLQLWFIAYSIEGMASGVWRADGDELTVVRDGDHRTAMSALMCGMTAPLTAAGTVVVTCTIPKRQRRFPYERALRELYVEVGMVGQRLIVACERLGLGCLVTPATNDHQLSALLGLEEQAVPVYSVTFGRKLGRGHGDLES